MQKSNFSEIIKKDELGQYHIRMGQKVYVIDAMHIMQSKTSFSQALS